MKLNWLISTSEMVEMVEIISTWAPPKVEMVEIASKSCDFIVNNNIKIQS